MQYYLNVNTTKCAYSIQIGACYITGTTICDDDHAFCKEGRDEGGAKLQHDYQLDRSHLYY